MWLTSALSLILTSSLLAQERSIAGSVTDESGSPMPGVSVVIRGTSQGTATDTDGRYTLTVPGDDATIVFSFVGYATSEVVVGSRSVVDVQLTPDVRTLTELVVTGYAVQEKKDLTGSVGVVSPTELIAIPSSNVTNQLQGRVAGVTVTGDGRPGEQAKVRIRGFGSFQNNDPLYVVDGVPTQDISTLNPGDVESLSVLKDAGAASIYGSRASNGVIVITTKRGASSGVDVNYSMYYGTQDPGKGPDNLLNAQEFADLQWLVYSNDGTNETHPIYGPSTNANPTLPSWAGDTNWWDEVMGNAMIMNHDLSLSGGNENARFYGGLNYFRQDGIALYNYSKRFSARFNSEFKIKDRVTVGENITVSHRSGNNVNANGRENGPVALSMYIQPIIPVIMTEAVTGISHNFVPGEWGGTGIAPRLGNVRNIVAERTRDKDDMAFDVRIIGSVYADVKVIENLNFRTTFGGTFQNGYSTNYTFATYELSENTATPAYQEQAYYNNDWVWTNTLTYNKTFDSHRLLAVAGYEAVKYGIGRNLNGQRAGYFSDAVSFRTLSNGATIVNASSGYNTPTTLASTFLRADYSYGDKYFLSATVRRDGTSRFGEANRYGTFPSVSAGWRISGEPFMASISTVVTDLKIRGGYGTMGNQLAVSPQNAFYLYGGTAGNSFYDLNGTGNSSLQGFRPTRIGNPDAKWETNVTTNIGFDAGLFDNKLEVVFDWYTKKTKDLLYNPALPGTSGAADQPFINIAEMENTGVDLQVTYRKRFQSDFSFEAIGTFTTYNNEIKKVTDGIDYFTSGDYDSRIGDFNRNEVGHAVSEFYGYQVIGLFQSDAEVASAPTQDGAEPGFFRYADLDGDDVITAADRTYIGNPNPDFTYGLNLTFAYKGFDLTAFFYGSSGADIFNYNRWWLDFWPSFQNQKSKDLLYNSWTESRPNATTPKASNVSNFSNNTQSVSYYVEKGDFMRMRTLQLGYNLPQEFLGRIGLKNARIYVQGVNLFTITDYSGLDPDLSATSNTGNLSGSDLSFGVDQGNYPLTKQYIVGLNLGF